EAMNLPSQAGNATPSPAAQQPWLQYQHYTPEYVTTHAQSNPTPRPTLRRWVLGGLIVTASLVLAGLFALLFGYSFGVAWTVISLLAALLPLTLVLPLFLWLDRFE